MVSQVCPKTSQSKWFQTRSRFGFWREEIMLNELKGRLSQHVLNAPQRSLSFPLPSSLQTRNKSTVQTTINLTHQTNVSSATPTNVPSAVTTNVYILASVLASRLLHQLMKLMSRQHHQLTSRPCGRLTYLFERKKCQSMIPPSNSRFSSGRRP